MRDWKKAAAALAPDIPSEQLERIGPVLDGLEANFRPLAAELHPLDDPAFIATPEGSE